jgi:hypothetical protein
MRLNLLNARSANCPVTDNMRKRRWISGSIHTMKYFLCNINWVKKYHGREGFVDGVRDCIGWSRDCVMQVQQSSKRVDFNERHGESKAQVS